MGLKEDLETVDNIKKEAEQKGKDAVLNDQKKAAEDKKNKIKNFFKKFFTTTFVIIFIITAFLLGVWHSDHVAEIVDTIKIKLGLEEEPEDPIVDEIERPNRHVTDKTDDESSEESSDTEADTDSDSDIDAEAPIDEVITEFPEISDEQGEQAPDEDSSPDSDIYCEGDPYSEYFEPAEVPDIVNIEPCVASVAYTEEGDVDIYTTEYITLQTDEVGYNKLLCGSRVGVTRTCISRNRIWYEVYDVNPYGDTYCEYFGWVDSDYLVFH